MTEARQILLDHQLKKLKLPTILRGSVRNFVCGAIVM